MKVALVYDRVNKWGGAERVLLALHKLFPDAPLYTSVYHPGSASWADIFTVKTSYLQHVPFARRHHELMPLLMPSAFERFNFDDYDLVISVTSEAAKGIITRPGTKHICYCLTPTRYLWSGYAEYFRDPLFTFLTKPAVAYLRKWDIAASRRPDAFFVISKEVQRRVKRYYGRSSTLIYPPVTFGDDIKKRKAVKIKEKNFFLIVSRLISYKKIDIAIQACNELGVPLKIIGNGNKEQYLRSIAGPTVEFMGNLTDEHIMAYYKNCQALLFPGREDLGLTVLEAQRFGKPVIAFKGGGAVETIIHGKTGILFTPQTKDALKRALVSFDRNKFKERDCIRQAEAFSFAKFNKSFQHAVKQVI